MPPRIPPSTPAELAAIRMRKYRRRRRQGLLAVRAEIRTEVVTALVEQGWISREEVEDPVAVGNALAELVNDWALGKPTTQGID